MRIVTINDKKEIALLSGNLNIAEPTEGTISVMEQEKHTLRDLISMEESNFKDFVTRDVNSDGFSKIELSSVIHSNNQPRLQVTSPIASPGARIFAVARNYPSHVANVRGIETKKAVKDIEDAGIGSFLKITNTVVGPYEDIIKPARTNSFDYEVELAAVIGRKCKDVDRKDAMSYIFGYTMLIDYSLRELQEPQGTFNIPLKKNFDTSASVGPGITPAAEIVDPLNLKLYLTVNNQVRQNGTTAEMIHKLDELIAWYSRDLTLLPGDLISTGTCSGTAVEKDKSHGDKSWYLNKGDKVDAFIEGIGHIHNRIV